jgi:precorrin-6B methylase 2
MRPFGRHDRKKVSRQTYLGGGTVQLSADRVGPTGFTWGLDMTDEMLVLAERNKAAAGAENVQLLERCSPFRP